jgi:2-oxoglutarate dehydrogenase E2 component (dihydrolipoamide succinyltransferase)
MSKKKVVMPQMGESITTGTIVKWNKAVGDTIELDDILLEISTDKVESEIPSPYKGRLENILFPEGATVDVGVTIAEIETDLSAAPSKKEETKKPEEEKEEGKEPAEEEEEEEEEEEKEKEAPVKATKEEGKKTVEKKETPVQKKEEGKKPVEEKETSGERRFYTPLVKSMAKETGVSINDLSKISGSGAGGRVNRKDFEGFLAGKESTPSKPESKAAPKPSAPQSARVEIIPMTNIRKTIAKNMVLSKTTSPHVNSIAEVDLTHIVKFRESVKEEFKKDEGFNLTYSHFIMYALVKALREFPTVNASIDGDNIVIKKYINMGFAAATDDGLVVPVVKNADSLNMLGLSRAVNDLAEKARAKKLTIDDMSGGTFTFTNNGSFGVLIATPIILQPQVAIYCAGVIKKQLVVMKDDNIAVRSIMYGTHTYDHRLIDGAVGGNFLAAVHRNLEEMDPASLF